MDITRPKPPTLLSHRPVHTGRVLTMSVERVEIRPGHSIDLDIVRHPGAAAVVALDGDGRNVETQVLMVSQARYATGETLLEVPAGTFDGSETPEACAARELEEETGFRAANFVSLGFVWTTPGFCNERIWLFLATNLQHTKQSLDADEILTVVRMPFHEAVTHAEDGSLTDSKSVCALLRARAYLSR